MNTTTQRLDQLDRLYDDFEQQVVAAAHSVQHSTYLLTSMSEDEEFDAYQPILQQMPQIEARMNAIVAQIRDLADFIVNCE